MTTIEIIAQVIVEYLQERRPTLNVHIQPVRKVPGGRPGLLIEIHQRLPKIPNAYTQLDLLEDRIAIQYFYADGRLAAQVLYCDPNMLEQLEQAVMYDPGRLRFARRCLKLAQRELRENRRLQTVRSGETIYDLAVHYGGSSQLTLAEVKAAAQVELAR